MAPNNVSRPTNIPTSVQLRPQQQCFTTLCLALLATLITCPLDVAPTVSSKLPTGAPVTSPQASSRASNHKSGHLLLANAVPTVEVRPRLQQRPYFDSPARNVSCVVGQTVTLLCRVKHVGDRTVSWMRKRDLHILTSNIFTYTGDGRFSVIHPESSDDWNLRIEYVQARDGGIYECQVNTEPKINLATFLNVEDTTVASGSPLRPGTPAVFTQVGQASISGPDEVFVKRGSTISLLCSVNVHSTPAGSVMWYQGASVIDFDSPRGGISLETERTESGTTSKLLVTRAALIDSGNYTCLPSNARSASVYVHVLNGEHPAAMQHGEHAAASKIVSWSITLLAALATINCS